MSQLDHLAVLLLQLTLLLHVELDQLGERGELLAAIQVVKVARVLDLDVRDFVVSSVESTSR